MTKPEDYRALAHSLYDEADRLEAEGHHDEAIVKEKLADLAFDMMAPPAAPKARKNHIHRLGRGTVIGALALLRRGWTEEEIAALGPADKRGRYKSEIAAAYENRPEVFAEMEKRRCAAGRPAHPAWRAAV